jgi:lysine-N-methylase|tara:strand:+ start:1532 stop:2773 length:1242 start_codon:yes stop_codon:yes gene_type:complete
MSSRHHTVNAPAYIHEFKCIGSECPDTCCNGWQVDVNKATYKKIKALPGAAQHIKQHFTAVPGGNPVRHAIIVMGPDKVCPVQTQAGLCSIQADYGEELLSDTCRFYPRKITYAGPVLDMHLSLSCPEAARLCLNFEGSHELLPLELNVPKGKPLPIMGGGFKVREGEKPFPVIAIFRMLQDLILELSQRSSMPLWELVVLVGIVSERLELEMSAGDSITEERIEMIVLEGKLAALDGSFHNDLKAILPEDRVLGMRAIYTQVLTNERLNIANATGYQGSFFDLVADAFEGYNEFMDLRDSSGEVWSDGNQVVDKALRNYLRNQVGISSFPRLKNPNFLEQWRHIVIHYSLVSFYLQGLAKRHKSDFSMQHAVALVQSFSKAVEHNSLYIPRIDQLMKAAGIEGVAGLGILAR